MEIKTTLVAGIVLKFHNYMDGVRMAKMKKSNRTCQRMKIRKHINEISFILLWLHLYIDDADVDLDQVTNNSSPLRRSRLLCNNKFVLSSGEKDVWRTRNTSLQNIFCK